MKILVTGAAGFIGAHCVLRLLRDGHQVFGLDNFNDYYDPQLKRDRVAAIEASPGAERFRFVEAHLEDMAGLAALCQAEGFDGVVHLAAQAGVRYSITNPHAYAQSNLVGFVNMLEACRHHGVKHLVYASSSSVYGGNARMPFHEDDAVDHPVSLYAASKKANELMAHTYSHLFRLPTTGLRFFTVYGPWGRPDMALFLFTKAILEGRPIDVFNHGHMQRDFTYVDDIVEGVLRVLDKPATPEAAGAAPYRVFNIGNHDPVPLMDFIAAIERHTGKTAQKVLMDIQPGDVPATYADTAELNAWTGFSPATSVREGVRRFIRALPRDAKVYGLDVFPVHSWGFSPNRSPAHR